MWTNRDYRNLIEFKDFLDEHTELYVGTPFEDDDVVKEMLEDWFYYRKIVDNDRFERFYRRALNKYARQFYNYVRVETTDIDPLVSSYLERQILRSVSRASSESGTSSKTGGGGRTSSVRTSDTGTTSTNTTGTATSRGTSDSTSEDSTTTSGTSHNNQKRKHGETPQSAVGVGGSMALDWTYLSSQDETEDNGNTSGTTDSEGETNVVTTDNSSTTGTSQTTSQNGGTTTATESNNSSESGETTRETNGVENGDDRERMTGRNQSGQELLTLAREYIEKTNAFEWLTKKLDDCFMQIYEV